MCTCVCVRERHFVLIIKPSNHCQLDNTMELDNLCQSSRSPNMQMRQWLLHGRSATQKMTNSGARGVYLCRFSRRGSLVLDQSNAPKSGSCLWMPFPAFNGTINDNYQITGMNCSDSWGCGSNATLVWQRQVSLKHKWNKLALKKGFC